MAEKLNYNLLMEQEIERLSKLGEKKRLLLHVCCAPCSTACLEVLSKHFRVSVYFDNPNLDSLEEYERRLEEERRFVSKTGLAEEIIAVPYDSSSYYRAISGLENEREGGRRCLSCFNLRLEDSASYAKTHNFDYFTTTLTISPHKNAELLNNIGRAMGEKYGVKFLPSDFKKKEGFKRSAVLSDEYQLYRQDYCGCIFSKNEAEERRKNKAAEKPSK